MMKNIEKEIRHILDLYIGKYFIEDTVRLEWTDQMSTPQDVSDYITELLSSEKPCMISRFGSVELSCMIRYSKYLHPLWFLRKILPFWVPPHVRSEMVTNAGFFPYERKLFCKFSDLLMDRAAEVDLLGSWRSYEKLIESKMHYERCPLLYLEPYWASSPWTKCLAGKKVLVIHPFSETIKSQYAKRDKLFDNPDVLPAFESLSVIKSVQSIGGESNGFDTWFDALKYMEKQIDSVDYDIALIGCGAYGMPLAAYCKRQGKKAIHMGGVLQLLFGIKGNRWEEEGYGSDYNLDYGPLLANPYWVRPSTDETPVSSKKVEGACYW